MVSVAGFGLVGLMAFLLGVGLVGCLLVGWVIGVGGCWRLLVCVGCYWWVLWCCCVCLFVFVGVSGLVACCVSSLGVNSVCVLDVLVFGFLDLF